MNRLPFLILFIPMLLLGAYECTLEKLDRPYKTISASDESDWIVLDLRKKLPKKDAEGVICVAYCSPWKTRTGDHTDVERERGAGAFVKKIDSGHYQTSYFNHTAIDRVLVSPQYGEKPVAIQVNGVFLLQRMPGGKFLFADLALLSGKDTTFQFHQVEEFFSEESKEVFESLKKGKGCFAVGTSMEPDEFYIPTSSVDKYVLKIKRKFEIKSKKLPQQEKPIENGWANFFKNKKNVLVSLGLLVAFLVIGMKIKSSMSQI